MSLSDSIKSIKGIGEKYQALFNKVGVSTAYDLLHYYPRGYQRFKEPIPICEIQEGTIATICGEINGQSKTTSNRSLTVTTTFIKDETGKLKVVWYRMPFLKSTLTSGVKVTLRGRIVSKRSTLFMEHPEIYNSPNKYMEKLNTLQPVYPLTKGLTNNMILKYVRQIFNGTPSFADYLDADTLKKYQLYSYHDSIKAIHFPKDELDYINGRKRLVFQEFMLFILSIRMINEKDKRQNNLFNFENVDSISDVLDNLPYQLTKAQVRVWEEMKNDFLGNHLMNRLVQGDVGSGKTIIAVLGLIFVAKNGFQSAFMAPTEILAKQHYENIKTMLEEFGISLNVDFLTGSMTPKEKQQVYERIEYGDTNLVVGTNALIQDKVKYKNLALVITDEQHRFGVKQRESFVTKGNAPHVLVMSATPIPRTLAVILYGDLDISIIDELPKSRLPIKNCVVDTNYRNTAYKFIYSEIEKGRQCYIICPMVLESESLEAENVIDYTDKIKGLFDKSINISYLHGKMKQAEKDAIMEDYINNKIQILVSTTVIEVGIDVANASVMLIENAERFGLAQLHQLRGRVGRGKHQSYCIFMSSSKSRETIQRLEILNESNDGFYIASEDLRLRGPGDVFGIRQSGIMGFSLGDIYQDGVILKEASDLANAILEEDPKLEMEKHHKLKMVLRQYQSKKMASLTL